jgi:DNA-binding MarR family transcriptional regulator
MPSNLPPKGLTLSDLLMLPDDERKLINTMKRQLSMTLEELSAQLEESPTAIATLLDQLIQKGFVSRTEDLNSDSYQVCFLPKRGRDIPVKLMQIEE